MESLPQPQPEPLQTEPPSTHPSLVPITNAGNKDMTVYSRRRRKSKGGRNLASEAPKQPEPVIAPEEPKEADVVVTPEEIESEVSHETPVNDNEHNDLDLPIAHRKQPRSCTLHPIQNYMSYNALSSSYRAFVTSLDRVNIPKNIQEALEIPEWRAAVMEEMRALEKNGTWTVVEKPRGKKLVSCKWVFTPKYMADGTLDKLKARLVARGFTQTYGLDYQETFAPVAKLNTIRVLLSVAANLEWPLHQLDIKNAF